MTTLTYQAELTVLTCWCGMHHAVPTELRDFQLRQHRDGREVTSIYCPLGHQHQPSGKGEAVVERERRQRAEAQAVALRDQLEAERRGHAATKGQLTKTRKRTAGGACPCCNHSFVQLARHMATKHPDYAAAT